MELERLCNLKEGDTFIYYGLEREVRIIDNKYLHYGTRGNDNHFHQSDKVGAKSKEKVQLIKRKNEIQNS